MISAIAIILGHFTSPGTDPFPRNPSIDILHYAFRIEVNDTTEVIAGVADVDVFFRQPVSEFSLNLTSRNADGLGMAVNDVTTSGKPVAFRHAANLLSIHTPLSFPANDTVTFTISYRGIPVDGLVIGKNKFGDRTFFGDNWPDRGRHWLPAIDHPYDKAKVEFIVTAPDHYQVVATGERISEKKLPGKRTLHHWRESNDVAVKVMTIGVARFAIQQSGTVEGIPVSTWVFPQNSVEGFIDFSDAPQVLKFMQDYIGAYPYEKLAHVQSKTRFGGLENASNIFYSENSVNGMKENESLIAHETAHQWFGDAVTENDWHHVWLSEGFATYFSALYLGETYGGGWLFDHMAKDREAVIKFHEKQKTAIIDTTVTDINNLLNTNTYQKAAWFLHMLREKIGPDNFRDGIRSYYAQYRHHNASTDDFLEQMELASGQDLDDFFQSWLYQPGHPKLAGIWAYDKSLKKVRIEIKVSGFVPPKGTVIHFAIQGRSHSLMHEYPLDRRAGEVVVVDMSERPEQILLDPLSSLLFEGEIREKR